MGLLDDMSRRDHVLVLDACQTGDPPGTLIRLAGDEVPVYFTMRISPHQLGLSDVLATLELSGERPAELTVLGLVPQSLEMCLELSELIAEKLDSLVEAVVEELAILGYRLKAKAG
jgi:hydrogenase maturation protease